jgi:hypothetical protein
MYKSYSQKERAVVQDGVGCVQEIGALLIPKEILFRFNFAI